MKDDVPSVRDCATAVSTLHLNSMGKSPTGQFGFHETTHIANVPVNRTWNSSWAAFWAQQVKSLFDQGGQIHERDDELAALQAAYFEKVIPRYLGPLESEGRSIEPCLVHSDLWPGNIKPKSSSGELCMFDAAAYWGHNEADLAVCTMPKFKPGQSCIDEITVYANQGYAIRSIMFSDQQSYRQILVDKLKKLLEDIDELA